MTRVTALAWAEQTNKTEKTERKAVMKMTTAEKIAYLKGVIAASNISDSQTKRIYEAITDVLDSLAEEVEFNTQNIDNIDSRLSEVDDDLDAVETFIFDDELFDEYADDFAEEDFAEDDDFAEDEYADDFEEYEDYDTEDFDDEFVVSDFDSESDEALDDALKEDIEEDIEEAEDEEDEFAGLEDEEEGEEMYEIECPACHETIYLQESVILDGAVDCPNCGEPLEFDIEFEE